MIETRNEAYHHGLSDQEILAFKEEFLLNLNSIKGKDRTQYIGTEYEDEVSALIIETLQKNPRELNWVLSRVFEQTKDEQANVQQPIEQEDSSDTDSLKAELSDANKKISSLEENISQLEKGAASGDPLEMKTESAVENWMDSIEQEARKSLEEYWTIFEGSPRTVLTQVKKANKSELTIIRAQERSMLEKEREAAQQKHTELEQHYSLVTKAIKSSDAYKAELESRRFNLREFFWKWYAAIFAVAIFFSLWPGTPFVIAIALLLMVTVFIDKYRVSKKVNFRSKRNPEL